MVTAMMIPLLSYDTSLNPIYHRNPVQEPRALTIEA